jgi:cyclopropane-fatty-acyl-phospholipid synthase
MSDATKERAGGALSEKARADAQGRDPLRDGERASVSTSARASARIVCALLDQMTVGSLELVSPSGQMREFGPGGAPAPGASEKPARLVLRDYGVLTDALRGGDVAFGEAYIEGRFETPDLTHLLTVFAANQAALSRAFYGRWWTRTLLRLHHLLRSNTRSGARRNIVAHYDLGNAFYALWLDPTMTYSCALFEGEPSRTLAEAQHAKYARLLAELDLTPRSSILEIGCGWGGFAEAAARAGHKVLGISLSPSQSAYAQERLTRATLRDRATVKIHDYRDVRGAFDAVASIEMFEAVGERWWPTYFRVVHDALRVGGRACIQAITIDDARFERYRTQSDFIQQYIFPGGMLASPSRLVAEAEAAGLALVRSHAFGSDYATTLERWLAAFDARTHSILALGYDERFIRCWRFYLAFCAAGFATATTDVAQYTFVRRG